MQMEKCLQRQTELRVKLVLRNSKHFSLNWQNWMMFSIRESIMRKIREQPKANQQNNVLEGNK